MPGSPLQPIAPGQGSTVRSMSRNRTSPEKLVQIEAYGARLKKVAGSRERTAEVTMEAALKTYYASHCWNPFFLHGTKTFAFEVWEQMGWKAPDTLVLPVGHGTLLLGSYIGFKELKEAGLVKKIPKLVGVQSASCAPLYQAFKKGTKREDRSLEFGVEIGKKEDHRRGDCDCQAGTQGNRSWRRSGRRVARCWR